MTSWSQISSYLVTKNACVHSHCLRWFWRLSKTFLQFRPAIVLMGPSVFWLSLSCFFWVWPFAFWPSPSLFFHSQSVSFFFFLSFFLFFFSEFDIPYFDSALLVFLARPSPLFWLSPSHLYSQLFPFLSQSFRIFHQPLSFFWVSPSQFLKSSFSSEFFLFFHSEMMPVLPIFSLRLSCFCPLSALILSPGALFTKFKMDVCAESVYFTTWMTKSNSFVTEAHHDNTNRQARKKEK